jgi:hypothetical protein
MIDGHKAAKDQLAGMVRHLAIAFFRRGWCVARRDTASAARTL